MNHKVTMKGLLLKAGVQGNFVEIPEEELVNISNDLNKIENVKTHIVNDEVYFEMSGFRDKDGKISITSVSVVPKV